MSSSQIDPLAVGRGPQQTPRQAQVTSERDPDLVNLAPLVQLSRGTKKIN